MIRIWVKWVNCALGATVALLLMDAAFLALTTPSEFSDHGAVARKTALPKSVFTRPQEDYLAIGAPVLALNFSPQCLNIPDLRRHLTYYGKNGRPDADTSSSRMHFALGNNKAPVSAGVGDRLYVACDKSQQTPQFVFSAENAETSLWIEAKVDGGQAIVKPGMKVKLDEEGEVQVVSSAEFTLPEKEYVRFGNSNWELGPFRVDGTLLARQKARWYGMDRFLEKHGGEEFQDVVNKHRVDFGEGDEIYSVYLNVGSYLVWKEDRWRNVTPGEATLGAPILSVKKVEDRIMNLELWDVDGKGKVALNLIRSTEAWAPGKIEEDFKFVGARTKSQLIFEIQQERVLLKPNDWLVFNDNEWKKLECSDEIDQYVERKLVGPLFVFNHIERKDDRQVVCGTLFNASRTEAVPVEFPLQQVANAAMAKKQPNDRKMRNKNEPHQAQAAKFNASPSAS